GVAVPQDSATAIRWYRLAAQQDDIEAQLRLGQIYNEGIGVAQDGNEAVNWFRQAAMQGDAEAQFKLGVMYKNGVGVPQDMAEAARWYRAAAEQGYAKAQNNLGYMYGTGNGVPQDYVLAHLWYNQAGANGIELGIKNRDKLAREMTSAQIAMAQRLAREWMARCEDTGSGRLSATQTVSSDVSTIESALQSGPPAAGPATRAPHQDAESSP
ncbi:MAG: sel1 repeat family protein, partial [Gammaproteobacteria bacterium]|nr:sel1 repeat family protein [Gammaproteobacteria bacterium]